MDTTSDLSQLHSADHGDGHVDLGQQVHGTCSRFVPRLHGYGQSTNGSLGTSRYFDDTERPHAAADESARLKCDTSGPVPIILVPQPSDDPNDPLNWPLWKRDLILLILSLVSVFATCLGPILAANTLTLSCKSTNFWPLLLFKTLPCSRSISLTIPMPYGPVSSDLR